MKLTTLDKTRRVDLALAALLFAGGSSAVMATADGIGITVDEPVYGAMAQKFTAWLRLFSAGATSPFSHNTLNHYWAPRLGSVIEMQPPLPKIVSSLCAMVTQDPRSGTALMFGLLLASIYLACYRSIGRGGALFAAATLATMPRVFGHAHLLTLDVPMAFTAFIATIALSKAVTGPGSRSPWLNPRSIGPLALGSVALGLALCTKANALLIPFAIAIWLVLARVTQSAQPPRLLPAVTRLAVSGAGALVVMVLLWCWLWPAPIERLLEYFSFHLKHYPIGVYYFGQTREHAPFHYPLIMAAITTPPLTLLMALFGIFLAIRVWRTAPPLVQLSLVSAFVQIGPFLLATTPKYNGVRLFLSAFPFLAVACGYTFMWFIHWLKHSLERRTSALRPAVCSLALGAAMLTPAARDTLGSHPYELSFYNSLVGGTKGAISKGFEGTYWGDTLMGLTPFINSKVPDGARILLIPSSYQYLLEFYQQAGMLKRELVFVNNEKAAMTTDFVIFQCRQSEFSPLAWKLWRTQAPEFSIQHNGARLAVIYRLHEN